MLSDYETLVILDEMYALLVDWGVDLYEFPIGPVSRGSDVFGIRYYKQAKPFAVCVYNDGMESRDMALFFVGCIAGYKGHDA